MYSSTCFGCSHAHHQELNNCSSSLWFYRWSVVLAVLLFVVWAGKCIMMHGLANFKSRDTVADNTGYGLTSKVVTQWLITQDMV